MKTKSFLLGAAALMLATACSNEEVVEVAPQSVAIGFSSFVDNSTRTDFSSAYTPSSLKVYGVSNGTQSGTFKLFAGQIVEKGDDGKWSYSPLKYWIAGNNYTFAAVAPSEIISDGTLEAGKVKVNQGVDMNYGGVSSLEFINSGNVDLLWAAPANITNVSTSRGPVTLELGHLLTRICFKFVNGTKEGEDLSIKVSDVKITDAANAATWTPTDAWTVTDEEMQELDEYTFGMAAEYKAANASVTSATQNLIPEGANKEYTATFTITLKEKTADDKEIELTYNHTITIKGTTFEAGKSYTLTANVDMTNVNPEEQINPILFEVKVDDWTNVSDVATTLHAKPITSNNESGE